MKETYTKCLYFLLLIIFSSQFSYSQKNTYTDSTQGFKTVPAGAQYLRSSFYQWLMGKNHRKEWTTPVKVSVMLLDTARGGLKAYKTGGGHQTKALHVKTARGKEYSLRSVDKTLGKVLPEVLHKTFLEDIVNDEVSMSHPYGAASVPALAEKAGIFHTWPQYVYLPNQRLLDTFNNAFGNSLYLFEERLSGSWKEAANLGNFKKFYDTHEIQDEIYKDNRYQVNQQLYVKCRLFDMLIGDWDRHEDQWQWGLTETKAGKIYHPLPQDRDQAYFKYDGTLLKLLISAAGLKYFQAFDYTLPDVNSFNYEERNLDRFFANKMTFDDWQKEAKELQQALTDEAITESIKQLPPEIFAISGNEIIAKLKSRRNHLTEYAATYYRFISKEVEIIGSKASESFEITRVNDNETAVRVYRITKEKKEQIPFYSRNFRTGETKEVRLYGLSGNDIYTVDGNVNKGINIRIIGGNESDSIVDRSMVKAGKKMTKVYDNMQNSFTTSKETKLHISPDTAIHAYKYSSYLYDKKGVGPNIGFNYEDRLFVGVNAQIVHNKWRRSPFAYKHQLALNYSISQHAFSATYHGRIPAAIGKWDILMNGNYDANRWTKFFGLGNETPLRSNYNDFYRMQSEEWLASTGLNRKFRHNNISIYGFFRSTRIINDPERFVPKFFSAQNSSDYNTNRFVGAKLQYIFDQVNDSITPTKGITFSGNVDYSHNISQSSKNLTRYVGRLQLYVPLLPKLSLSINTAGFAVSGNPLFYQHVSIGGPETLRGYRLERFWGKTAFYDANELRYITNIKSYIYNGKAGLLALFDNGRVWMPGETSRKWHTSYGGGILLAPFNKILIVVTYAISEEMKLFQLRVGRSF